MQISAIPTYHHNITFTSKKNQSCKTSQMTGNEYLLLTRTNENLSDKFVRKILEKTNPKRAVCKQLNQLVTLRNRNCPNDKLDMDFIKEPFIKNCPAEDLKYLVHVVYLPNNSRQLTKEELINLAQDNYGSGVHKKMCTNIINFKLLYDIEGREKPLSIDEAKAIAHLKPEEINTIFEKGLLEDIKGRQTPLNAYEIRTIAEELTPLHPKQQEKILNAIEERKLLTAEFGSSYLDADKVIAFGHLNTQGGWEVFKNNGILKFHQSYDADAIQDIMFYNEDEMERCKVLFEETKLKYSRDDLAKIINMKKEIFENFIKISKSDFTYTEIGDIIHTSKLSPDILEKYHQAKEDAYLKRNLLKDGIHDLTDEEINNFFATRSVLICDTIDTIGLPAFEYAYASKLAGLDTLVNLNKNRNYETFQPVLKKLLDDKTISPEERIDKFRIIASIPEFELRINDLIKLLKDKTIPADERISKLKKFASTPEYKQKIKDLILKGEYQSSREILYEYIKPHNVTPEHVAEANEIWSQHGKTFDEKYLEFCKKFSISPNDEKIRNSIEKLATVNKNGFKLLYNIGSENLKEVIKKKHLNEFNQTVSIMIFDALGVNYDKTAANKLKLEKSRYIGNIFTSSSEFKTNFKELVENLKENPDKSVKEVFDELPQNIKTKAMFNKLGINYEKWCEADSNSNIKIKIYTENEKAKEACIKNLEADLCDTDFKKLPKNQTSKIFNALKTEGYTLKQTHTPCGDYQGETMFIQSYKLFKNNNQIEFSDLPKIMNIIKKEINSNEFWFKKDTSPNADVINQAKRTVLNHFLKLRDNEIKETAKLKRDEYTEITVRKTDMNNISHSLFLGNHAGCCTAVASSIGNDYAAPRYVMDKFIQAIEVMDGKEFIGNTMCYIAKVNNIPSLILDNIELTTKYQYNNNIRDAIFEYAKKLCTDIGCPDMHVYAGPLRHKVKMPSKAELCSIQIIGDTDGQATYIDFSGEAVIDGKTRKNIYLYRIS